MSIKSFGVWTLTCNYLQIVFDRPCLQIADVFNEIVHKLRHGCREEACAELTDLHLLHLWILKKISMCCTKFPKWLNECRNAGQ